MKDHIQWYAKGDKREVDFFSAPYALQYIIITFTSQRNREKSTLYVSLTSKTSETLPVDYVSLIKTRFGRKNGLRYLGCAWTPRIFFG